MHTALFAVGDLFGATGSDAQARALRSDLEPILNELLEKSRGDGNKGDSDLYPVSRAVGYLVVVTAHAEEPADVGKSLQILKSLYDHPDPTTKHLGEWAVKYRFDPQGRVRPLHAAR
jgi:hypothetical protein